MYYCDLYGEAWYFFPMIFFITMIIFFVIVYRRGNLLCNWRGLGRKRMKDCYKTRSFESANDILKKRYVKGEINKEDFKTAQNLQKKAMYAVILSFFFGKFL